MKTLKTFIFLAFIGLNHSIDAQTCCSGGVPMSGNLGLPVGSAGSWQFSLSYDLNSLNTLKDGTRVLNDKTRKRTTHSVLTEIGYTLNDRFSIDAFFSYVQQVRELFPIGQEATQDKTNGIGDAVLLFKYRFYKNFQIGVGVKLPLGPSDLRNDIGLRLGADLQPGSGAWDLIYWLSGSQPLASRKSMALSATLIYRATGKNDEYLGRQVYEFGNEFQAIVGVGDRFIVGSMVIDPSLSLKYRSVRADRTNANDSSLEDVPSTGGKWLFIRPALTYNINSDFSIQSNIELPLYAKLVNTQVTPSMRFNIGFLYSLKPKKIVSNELKNK